MDIHTHIVLTEINLRVAEAERRAERARALAETGAERQSLRARTATLLIAVARKLSPEAVRCADEEHPWLHA